MSEKCTFKRLEIVGWGLRYPTMDRMTSDALCEELVLAWLNQQDNVMKESGKPTWESLMKALKTIGHEGLAQKIAQGSYCQGSC